MEKWHLYDMVNLIQKSMPVVLLCPVTQLGVF